MKAGRWYCLICAIIGSLFLFAYSSCVEAAQFSADMVQHLGEKSKAGKIYVKDSKYRMEEKENGQQIIVIVDQEAGITKVMAVAEKKYMEMKVTDMISLMNDPFQATKASATRYNQKPLGSETINGFECEKSSFYSNDQLLMTQWVSKKLKFHLKIAFHGAGGKTVELENIKEGPVDEALFQVPAGYAKKEDPQKKREEERAALAAVTTEVKGEMPWARRIGPGGEIRVKVDPQKSVRFKVKNLIKGESVFTIKAFRNGRPIKIDIEETYSLKGSVEPLLGFQNKAEEVAVRVEKGKVIAQVMAEDSPFAKDKTKSFFIMTGVQDHQQGMFIDSKRPLRLSLTSDSQDGPESKIKVKFYKGDYQDKIDELEAVLINGQTKTWEYPAEKGIKTLDITVAKKGGVKVRIIQCEPFQLTKDTKAQVSLAIQNNDLGKIKAFLDSGLDVNATLEGDGTTVLMKASNSADAEMVEMLLSRGADINYTNKYGWTALLKALDNRKHWIAVTPVLVNSGADVNAKLKSNGHTPLWKAIGRISKNRDAAIEIIKMLLSKGADVNSPYISKDKRYSGETPLMSASKKGSTDVVKLLLSHGADVNASTKAGQTALDYARKKGHQEIVKLLTAEGTNAPAPTEVKEKATIAKPESKPSLSEGQKPILEEEIPTYKGAKVRQSGTIGNQRLIDMESTESPEEIMNFYKAEMTKKGWSEKMALAQTVAKGKMATVMMVKGEKVFRLTAIQRAGKTRISIIIAGK
jgi:ankyrin repeat protein